MLSGEAKPLRQINTNSSDMFVCRALYHSDVQKVPSRALRLRFLSEAAEQRHVQGAE